MGSQCHAGNRYDLHEASKLQALRQSSGWSEVCARIQSSVATQRKTLPEHLALLSHVQPPAHAQIAYEYVASPSHMITAGKKPKDPRLHPTTPRHPEWCLLAFMWTRYGITARPLLHHGSTIHCSSTTRITASKQTEWWLQKQTE